ncbi:nucleotidyltransferase domain-containing protein [Nocardioides bruguierae]|uniref:Nucleotidyltransferase domain-containing protein n=1 Tax=Nocardioides bruguierae TaxID=2945102 RepID=A0A9X2DA32_9ACTN|nr:nucleotidyltransferase domain-containing protein [Nocardioides bruguierae]MCM0621587.1 nucleotidyltransferase domain-containing protein [Nocardioides bruguierae]
MPDPRVASVLEAFADAARALGATAVWVGGSWATGDHVAGVSDLDLVVLVPSVDVGAVDDLHRHLDAGPARGLDLGCAWVEAGTLGDPDRRHVTWSHGRPCERRLSSLTRLELAAHGLVLAGRSPADVLPAPTPGDVRRAVRADLDGYWRWALRRPWYWLAPDFADLSLLTMARARRGLTEDLLVTKAAALAHVDAGPRLRRQLAARRAGERCRSPRSRTAWAAWRDAVRTVG